MTMKDRIHPNLRVIIDNMTEEQRETISKKLAEPSEVSYEEIQQRLQEAFTLHQPSATISGWVVRDKQNITTILAHRGSKLYLCEKKPKRIDSMGIWDKEGDYYRIPDDLFPNVAFDSDPLEVEITIKPKKR